MRMQGKTQVLSEVTSIIMETMEIIGLHHSVTYDIMVDTFDSDCKERIQALCDENGLTWKVIPYPYQHYGGFSTIKQKTYIMEKIGAKIILSDPTQTDEVIPSIKEYNYGG